MAEGRRAGPIAAGLLLLWYAATMARGLEWFDSAELALVGRQLGLGHPPGQPLYTWLAGLFSRLPGLDPLVGLNLLSALPAALCALPADAILRRATSLGTPTRVLVLVASGAAVPVWDQATRIELYALSTLLFLGVLAAGQRAESPRSWALAGLLVGLLAAVNPVFAIGAAAGAGLYGLPGLVRRKALLRSTGAAFVGAVVGLVPYVHLLLVRDAPDRLVWGELSDPAGLLKYLAGADYAMTEHAAFGSVAGHVATWLAWMLGQGAVAPLVGALGWLAAPGLRRRSALLAAAAVVGFGFTMTYGVYFPEIPDFNGYLTPALWLAALGIGGLVEGRRLAVPAVAGLLAVTLCAGEQPLWSRSRADITLPRELARRHLDAAEPNALLLVESDHLFFPLLYLQEIEGARPDVAVINVGWSASSWYWRFLYRRHPDLPPLEPAPSREIRLRSLVVRVPVARVETHGLAARLGVRPCPATWGFALGPACAEARDDEAAFTATLASWWSAGPDPMTTRVIAAVANARAEGLWALGDATGALRAWRAGVDPSLPVPERLPPGPRRPVPLDVPELIGSPDRNRALGAAALIVEGHPELAEAWLRAE